MLASIGLCFTPCYYNCWFYEECMLAFVVFSSSPHFYAVRARKLKSRGFIQKNSMFTSLALLLAISCRSSRCTLPHCFDRVYGAGYVRVVIHLSSTFEWSGTLFSTLGQDLVCVPKNLLVWSRIRLTSLFLRPRCCGITVLSLSIYSFPIVRSKSLGMLHLVLSTALIRCSTP